ncbi:MAG: M23 family metallopeptidase [Novosphingobium sp.]|uniref:M23 family metallopeptidase n=1 Tax=Novosphingobium sp. TaxID=1874826 RepID=UPI0030190A90
MRITTHLLVLAASLLPFAAAAQTHSGFPVNVIVPKEPSPVQAGGRTRLVYELHMTNFYPGAIELAGIEVVDGETTLASWRGAELKAMLMPVGPEAAADSVQMLEGGRTAVAFIDLTLAPGVAAPRSLRHRLLFSVKIGDGKLIERTVEGVGVDIQPSPLRIAPPLRGGRWVAANGLFAADHRRSFNAVDGREHLAQRFAIDWVLLGPDGRFFRKDASANANFPGYGADVIAVASGVVSHIKADLPDNAGNNPQSERTVTLESITGNAIVLDLGGGRFALYAHLQPGSIKVAVGDRVEAGQVLARLGNSGNSDAPHLHFQLMDANSPLGAEGIPYELTAFTQTGVLPDLTALDTGKPWQPAGTESVGHRGEFPEDRAVVSFP